MRLLPIPPEHAHVPELQGATGLMALEGFDQAVVDNIHKHGEHPAG